MYFLYRVFCDVLIYVSYRGYVGILLSVQLLMAVNQGGTADSIYSSLTEHYEYGSVRDVFYFTSLMDIDKYFSEVLL